MDWYEVALVGSRTTTFAERDLSKEPHAPGENSRCGERHSGGIIYGGRWGWVSSQYHENGLLIISSLSTGECIARYVFGSDTSEHQCCNILCVEELFPERTTEILLAVCLEYWIPKDSSSVNCSRAKTNIAIYAPTFNQILRYIELDNLYVSTMRFMNNQTCRRSYLQAYDGCLAVGTDKGEVAFLDVNYKHVNATRSQIMNREIRRAQIKRVGWTGSLDTINMILHDCRQSDKHFAIEMHVAFSMGVRSILPLDIVSCFAAGLDDGRIVLINLKRFVTFHTIMPPEEMAVKRMCCIVPPDDPQPCFYICAMYENSKGESKSLSISLYAVHYEQSFVDEADNQRYFEKFQYTCSRLHTMLDKKYSSIIGCATVSTFSFAGDKGTMLVILSWYSHNAQKNKVVFIDINQWYKDEICNVTPGVKPNFMSGYILSGLPTGIALLLEPTSILHFDCLQRHDEHFYPNSLTFNCSLLTATGCRHYAHDGVQHQFLKFFRRQRADIFLNPEPYYNEIMRLRLTPQFFEPNPYSEQAKCVMYEMILSVALENNCVGLLNDCAKNWVDGSFLCNMLDPTLLSLSTLTNWILKRARQIKSRIRELCQGIFDYAGYPLDDREKKEFTHLVAQLHLLWKLQSTVKESGKRNFLESVLKIVEINEHELRLLYDYYRVLLWLTEHDLLPQGQQQEVCQSPCFYAQRRAQLAEMRGEGHKLYIDAMLEHRGFGPALRQAWATDVKGGLYPPKSLDSLLAVIQTTDDEMDHKYELILYALMDLNEQLVEVPSGQLVHQFGLSFGLSEHLVRTVTSFWILDRGDCLKAVQELYNVRGQIKHYEEWQMQHLINVLLAQGDVKSAVRVIDMPPGIVSPLLRLRVLLANENIPEAFHHARQYSVADGDSLLADFFSFCIRASKFKVLAELSLREDEEALVYRLLRDCKSKEAECVQLILLLQKSKYIEAVSYMDEIAAKHAHGVNPAIGDSFNDASNMILSAYRATMAPVTKNIAGTYFRIKDKLSTNQLKNAAPEPFSCQLVKQNANSMLGGIFQSSALSAHWATRYHSDAAQPNTMTVQNVPFLRNPQYDVMSSPQHLRKVPVVRPVEYLQPVKRYRECENDVLVQYKLQPKKRRRLLGEEIIDDVCSFVKQKLSSMPDNLQPAPQSQPPPQKPTHSILKQRTTSAVEPRFSFMPPISLQMDEPVLPMDASSNAANEIIVTIEDAASEQNQSPMSERSDSDTEDEYLSPAASANVSLVQAEAAASAVRPYAGPQPRSSLSDVRLEMFACRPMPATQLVQATESKQASSGFGSFEQPVAVEVANTASLKPNEFVPIVCSSKVCHTQSEFSRTDVQVNMCERTTVCIEEGHESTGGLPLTATATSCVWPTPSMPQPLQMLDTTLGMTAYHDTTLEATLALQEQQQRITQNANFVMETTDNSVEFVEANEPADSNAADAARDTDLDYSAEFVDSPNAQRASREASPSYSLNSEVSDMSSDVGNLASLPQLQSDPMYSIVVESTNSITNSRSVSQTPTSFLPSDTNVSQNSGSQDTRGNGSPRSLYRANSLETVDDLDTTKGSLDDEDDEDDCVIALDGTKVRDYVPRAPEAAVSSIAELFAYKDECNEAGHSKSQSTSAGGATVNTDSLIAEQLDDSQPKQLLDETAGSSNHSVVTVAFSESKQQAADDECVQVLDATNMPDFKASAPEAATSTKHDCNEPDQSKSHSTPAGGVTVSTDSLNASQRENRPDEAADSSNDSVVLVDADVAPVNLSDVAEHTAEMHGTLRHIRRAKRAVSAPPENMDAVPRYNLRVISQTSPQYSPRPGSRSLRSRSRESSLDSPINSNISSSPRVMMPRRRKRLLGKNLLDVIDEKAALDTGRTPRTEAELPMRGSGKTRKFSVDNSTSSGLQRKLRSTSEPPEMQGTVKRGGRKVRAADLTENQEEETPTTSSAAALRRLRPRRSTTEEELATADHKHAERALRPRRSTTEEESATADHKHAERVLRPRRSTTEEEPATVDHKHAERALRPRRRKQSGSDS